MKGKKLAAKPIFIILLLLLSVLNLVPAQEMNLVFYSGRTSNNEIFKMDIDGSKVVQLTDDPTDDNVPAVSHDGTQIAYSLHRFINGRPEADIHVMSADGSNDKVLTSAPGRDENAAWGPDDSYIFFQSERNGNFEIFRMKSDGSEQMQLTADPSWDGWVSAAPVQASVVNNMNNNLAIEVFPNPASAHFNIEVQNWKPGTTLKIMDLTGRLVESISLNTPISEIASNNLVKGNYTLQVVCNDKISNSLLVIQ